MNDYTHIAWIDLETTGLDPKYDAVIEFGLVLTDRQLTEIDEKSWLVLPESLDMLKLNETVREMHNANGLLNDLITSRDLLLAPTYLQYDISNWLRDHIAGLFSGDSTIALGGSGVSHFDVRWLQLHFPHVATMFHRSTLDVGVIRRFIENVVGRPDLVPQHTRDLTHRALDDARQHLAEARHYKQVFSDVQEILAAAFNVAPRPDDDGKP